VGEVEHGGFTLEARSEINANPKDTKDYPFGVWTLPPTRRTHAKDQPSPAGFDPARYEAIGESDRMTLRFRKA
jgi:predicted methyltransferase